MDFGAKRAFIRVSPDFNKQPMIPTSLQGQRATATPRANYAKFLAELTLLTRKYGIAVKSVGGVFLADDPNGFARVTYVADVTSGDLLPRSPDWED